MTNLAPPSTPRFIGLKHENCFKKSEKDVESGALSEYRRMPLVKRVVQFGRQPKSSKSSKPIGETCARHLPVLSHQSARVLPKLGPYESTIRAWLTEDLKVPKKQRHSATRIWQRLVDECGADVSVSAVRVMVRELRS